jgi:hypothetical protein
MIRNFILNFIFIFSLCFLSCSKSSNPVSDNSNQNNAAQYYPGNTGSKFNYAVQVDSLGGTSQGERIVSFNGSININNTDYFIQANSTILANITANTNSYFRRTSGGIYFFVDTTGLYKFFPDSLRSLLTAEVDKEMSVFSSSLDSNIPWKVYKMNVKYGNLYTFNIIDLTATYLGSEELTLGLNTGQVNKSSEKIKYVLTLSIPNLSDLSQSTISKFEAVSWFAKDLGLVKNQGNLTVVNAISGYDIDFDDTTKTILQNITAYDIK